MSVRLDVPSDTSVQDQKGVGGWDDWDLDVSIVESGVAAEQLIRMTDDGCGSTCQSACDTCP